MAIPDRIVSNFRCSRGLAGIGLRLAGAGTVALALNLLIVSESPIQEVRDGLKWLIPAGFFLWILAVGFFAASVAARNWAEPTNAMSVKASPLTASWSKNEGLERWLLAARFGVKRWCPSLYRLEWSLPLLRSLPEEAFLQLGAGYFEAIGFRAEVDLDTAYCDIWLLEEDADNAIGIVRCLPCGEVPLGIEYVNDICDVMLAKGVDHGVLLTPGDFSEETEVFVAGNSLELISGVALLEKLRELSPGVSQRLMRQLIETSASGQNDPAPQTASVRSA